jgi:Zn finger protein HypA/HybF involved in hydrogenase expression
MTPLDADGTGLLAAGRDVHMCEECTETFETARELLHVTCPACGTDAVVVVAHV